MVDLKMVVKDEGTLVIQPKEQTRAQAVGLVRMTTDQKVDKLLEMVAQLGAKVDRIGMNTVNLAKNQNELGLVMNSIIGLLEVPEPEPSIIVSGRGV